MKNSTTVNKEFNFCAYPNPINFVRIMAFGCYLIYVALGFLIFTLTPLNGQKNNTIIGSNLEST